MKGILQIPTEEGQGDPYEAASEELTLSVTILPSPPTR